MAIPEVSPLGRSIQRLFEADPPPPPPVITANRDEDGNVTATVDDVDYPVNPNGGRTPVPGGTVSVTSDGIVTYDPEADGAEAVTVAIVDESSAPDSTLPTDPVEEVATVGTLPTDPANEA